MKQDTGSELETLSRRSMPGPLSLDDADWFRQPQNRRFIFTVIRAYRRGKLVLSDSQSRWKPTHRHVKRGSEYMLIGDAEGQVSVDGLGGAFKRPTRHVEDGTSLRVYQAEDGKLWWRFPDEFEDGRFVAVDSTQEDCAEDCAEDLARQLGVTPEGEVDPDPQTAAAVITHSTPAPTAGPSLSAATTAVALNAQLKGAGIGSASDPSCEINYEFDGNDLKTIIDDYSDYDGVTWTAAAEDIREWFTKATLQSTRPDPSLASRPGAEVTDEECPICDGNDDVCPVCAAQDARRQEATLAASSFPPRADDTAAGVMEAKEEFRRKLLRLAETLWGDLQKNDLGGFSGINRPFWIVHFFRLAIAVAEEVTLDICRPAEATRGTDGWSTLDTAPDWKDRDSPEQIWVVSPRFPKPALAVPYGNQWRIRRDLALSNGQPLPPDLPTHWRHFERPSPPVSTTTEGE